MNNHCEPNPWDPLTWFTILKRTTVGYTPHLWHKHAATAPPEALAEPGHGSDVATCLGSCELWIRIDGAMGQPPGGPGPPEVLSDLVSFGSAGCHSKAQNIRVQNHSLNLSNMMTSLILSACA